MADPMTQYAALVLQELGARAKFAEENVVMLQQTVREKDEKITELTKKVEESTPKPPVETPKPVEAPTPPEPPKEG